MRPFNEIHKDVLKGIEELKSLSSGNVESRVYYIKRKSILEEIIGNIDEGMRLYPTSIPMYSMLKSRVQSSINIMNLADQVGVVNR